jgi:hypothetical protein
MTTLTIDSNFGNFDFVLRADVTDDQLQELARRGLLQIAQRAPASAAEKAMAGASWPKNKKGEPQRPKGFERSSIDFSEDRARVLASHLEKCELGEDQPLDVSATVSEHVESEGAEPKFKEEKAKVVAKNGDQERLIALAEAVGFDYSDGNLTTEKVPFLRAIRAFINGERLKAVAAL